MSQSVIPNLPLSLQELVDYYRIAQRECDFLVAHLRAALGMLEGRMKSSALVSVQFNNYESYYVASLQHLKWRLSDVCVSDRLEFKKRTKLIRKLQEHEYKHSGVGHPIDETEINPMLASLEFVRTTLGALITEIEASMLQSIFLCHSSADKPMVRRIGQALTEKGSRVWLDEAEILVGDSILEKVQTGIEKSDFLGVILSPRSVESIWVKKEVEAALTQEMESGRIKVLPILIEACAVPLFLRAKKYADLSSTDVFEKGIGGIVRRLSR
jgi:hypothetical protein